MDPNPLLPAGVDVVFGTVVVLITLLVVAGVAVGIVLSVRQSASSKEAGLDAPARREPVVGTAQRAAEIRLSEAMDLHARGLITADELGEIRQRILSEV